MKFEDKINEKLTALWCENFGDMNKDILMPLYYHDLKRHVPFFVGMNPSHSSKNFTSMIKGDKEFENFNLDEYFQWNINTNIDISIKLSSKAKTTIDFFKKFRTISKNFGDEHGWEHSDLFHYRLTNQKEFLKLVYKKKSKNILNQFGKKQIDIFFDILKYVEPKFILVANAKAGEIFRQNFPLSAFEEYGCDFIELYNVKTPVFFSSMLSGQRALDNESFKRLIWHIKFVLQNY